MTNWMKGEPRPLGPRLSPCGPVIDEAAATRAREAIAETVWDEGLEAAWPALAPMFAASAYLTSLARRDPRRLAGLLKDDPDTRLADILARTAAAGALSLEEAPAPLRRLKQELHLLAALADLGGVWDLDQV